jgi:hypothetical protein
MTSEWDFDPDGLKLLEQAARCLDRIEQARRQIDADGLTIEGRYGPRAHPALTVERDGRALFVRIIRQLGLEQDAPASDRLGFSRG